MTNNTITRQIDDTTYTLTLPDDDRACLRLALELQRDAAAEIVRAATRDLDPENPYFIDSTDMPLTQFDYSGDHDDYNPAAAHIALTITYAITAHEHETARDMLIDLFNTDDEFLESLLTADFEYTFPIEIAY